MPYSSSELTTPFSRSTSRRMRPTFFSMTGSSRTRKRSSCAAEEMPKSGLRSSRAMPADTSPIASRRRLLGETIHDFGALDRRRNLRCDARDDLLQFPHSARRIDTAHDDRDGATHIATRHRHGDLRGARGARARRRPIRSPRVASSEQSDVGERFAFFVEPDAMSKFESSEIGIREGDCDRVARSRHVESVAPPR